MYANSAKFPSDDCICDSGHRAYFQLLYSAILAMKGGVTVSLCLQGSVLVIASCCMLLMPAHWLIAASRR